MYYSMSKYSAPTYITLCLHKWSIKLQRYDPFTTMKIIQTFQLDEFQGIEIVGLLFVQGTTNNEKIPQYSICGFHKIRISITFETRKDILKGKVILQNYAVKWKMTLHPESLKHHSIINFCRLYKVKTIVVLFPLICMSFRKV